MVYELLSGPCTKLRSNSIGAFMVSLNCMTCKLTIKKIQMDDLLMLQVVSNIVQEA